MQTWMGLAIAAACLSALERVTHRVNLAGEGDTRGYALTFQAACTLLCLPLLAFAWPKLTWPPPVGVAAMVAAAICWAAFSVLTFKADTYEVKLRTRVAEQGLNFVFLEMRQWQLLALHRPSSRTRRPMGQNGEPPSRGGRAAP